MMASLTDIHEYMKLAKAGRTPTPAAIMRCIDLTRLEKNDKAESLRELCQKAINPLGQVAAICVYPEYLPWVREFLPHSPLKIALATTANFPAGNQSIEETTHEIIKACTDGADEIDVVFPYQLFLTGHELGCFELIRACKQACSNAILKVILETGALLDLAMIENAAECAIEAGADFLKTSTGKIAQGATLETAAILLLAAKQHKQRVIGCKISGGIKTTAQAIEYYQLAETILGSTEITPRRFRLGASSLLDDLIKHSSS